MFRPSPVLAMPEFLDLLEHPPLPKGLMMMMMMTAAMTKLMIFRSQIENYNETILNTFGPAPQFLLAFLSMDEEMFKF